VDKPHKKAEVPPARMRGESMSFREERGFILAVLGRRPKANDFSLHIAKGPPGAKRPVPSSDVSVGWASAPVSLGRIYELLVLLLSKGTVLVLAGGARQRGRDGLRFCRLLIDDTTMEAVLDALRCGWDHARG